MEDLHIDPVEAEQIGTACRKLYAAVLLQAVKDLCSATQYAMSDSRRSYERTKALAFFEDTDPEGPFHTICAIVGVDPGRVRRCLLGHGMPTLYTALGEPRQRFYSLGLVH